MSEGKLRSIFGPTLVHAPSARHPSAAGMKRRELARFLSLPTAIHHRVRHWPPCASSAAGFPSIGAFRLRGNENAYASGVKMPAYCPSAVRLMSAFADPEL